MSKPAAKTGAGPTVLVAIEQFFPKDQRIIQDEMAYWILPSGLRAFVWLMRMKALREWMVRKWEESMPGLWAGMTCRKRYIDEKLNESAGRMEAVINLGAGFDTRTFRLPALAAMPVWEVDQAENIRPKERRVRAVLGSIPSHLKLVSADFDRDNLDELLASHGYSANLKTFFVWEAVSQYLTEAGVRSTFDFFSHAPGGSQLAFTYIRRDFLEGRNRYGWEKGYDKYVVKDKLWIFGMDPEEWPGFLKPYGWQVIEDIGAGELNDRYVKPTGRNLASASVERIIHAAKT